MTKLIASCWTTTHCDKEFELKPGQYHNTIVAKWDTNTIILNNGGYMTATTKRRMNQAAETFKLGYRVFQHKGDWYVELLQVKAALGYGKNKCISFENGMTINRHDN